MFEIVAPWGQWKRGDMTRVTFWLKAWMNIAESMSDTPAFIIRKLDETKQEQEDDQSGMHVWKGASLLDDCSLCGFSIDHKDHC